MTDDLKPLTEEDLAAIERPRQTALAEMAAWDPKAQGLRDPESDVRLILRLVAEVKRLRAILSDRTGHEPKPE